TLAPRQSVVRAKGVCPVQAVRRNLRTITLHGIPFFTRFRPHPKGRTRDVYCGGCVAIPGYSDDCQRVSCVSAVGFSTQSESSSPPRRRRRLANHGVLADLCLSRCRPVGGPICFIRPAVRRRIHVAVGAPAHATTSLYHLLASWPGKTWRYYLAT